MDKLWAPWRVKYIRGKKKKGCIFCKSLKDGGKSLVFLKTKYSIAMLNLFPYNNGHAMVCPIRHIKDFTKLRNEEAKDLFSCLKATQSLLDKVLKPEGYNIGVNLSRAAGAGITGHLHIHIVPRWCGDTNFMPALFSTKVISQSLEGLFKSLKNAKSKKD